MILDWVPAHFPRDEWALARFDGTALYEHADERRGSHPDWGTLVFNLGRSEVQNFLLANALFWLREYHADGLRVDAVASMLYLDYSRKAGQWVPNAFGGREDLEAVAFLKELNELVHAREPGVISAAEESTAWPGVSRPTYMGGLGFGFKWNMGWMHDTLGYFEQDPIHRRYHHHELTFSLVYAWTENFILPLSHDEVVHGKGSLLQKMPGDRWQQLANLRALYALHVGAPGQEAALHGRRARVAVGVVGVDRAAVVAARARRARRHARPRPRPEPRSTAPSRRSGRSTSRTRASSGSSRTTRRTTCVAFMRVSRDGSSQVVCIANLSPVPREGYRVGLPHGGVVGGAAEHRLGALRRHRRRQPRRGEGGRARVARPAVLGRGDAAAALSALARAGPSAVGGLEEARDRAGRAGDDDHRP